MSRKGHLLDDVILPLRPEYSRVLLSCVNLECVALELLNLNMKGKTKRILAVVRTKKI